MNHKILIISHDSSRTGAPILLLNFLKALKRRNPKIIIDIIIGSDGPLTNEFKSIGRTLVVKPIFRQRRTSRFKIISNFNKLFESFFKYDYLKIDQKIKYFINGNYDVILSNTITNGLLLRALQPINCKVVSYVHELENAIKTFTSEKDFNYTLQFTDHFLVVSDAVSNNLKVNHNIPKEKITLLPSYVPNYFPSESRLESIKRKIKIVGDFVIGGVGTTDWRKGTDLFIQVALQAKKIRPQYPIKFIWVGASKGNEVFQRLEYDIKLAGLYDYIYFIESVENHLDYIACVDVFLLTSREDPYPMVVLEAAMLKKTIICFQDAGGANEFLTGNTGFSVPYLDTLAMSEIILELYQYREKMETYGTRAYDKYNALHSEDNAVVKLESFLKGIIDNKD